MSLNFKKNIRTILLVIFLLLVLCTIVQYVSVSSFNSTKHIYSSLDSSEDKMSDRTSIDIHFRGSRTSSWIKRDLNLYGIISDARIYNGSSDVLSSWTLRINISGQCYLNQFWNGDVEIHQHVGSSDERVQTLNLAHYDIDGIELEYVLDESDLLIPLDEGDYIIYYPEEGMREMPIESGDETIVGCIFYYAEDLDISDYTVEYYFHKNYTEGPIFVVICLLVICAFFVLGMYFTASYVYKRAKREMELRKSGLSSMSGLYTIIYIVDLMEDTIIPVSYPQGMDKLRPKNLGASEQFRNLFKLDAEDSYVEPMLEFSDLTTLPERIKNRNCISMEYVSKRFGWSRIRFINMDQSTGLTAEKVLFTAEQINEEKMEINKMLKRVEKAESKSRVKSVFLANISRDIKNPITVMIRLADYIQSISGEEKVRSYAYTIKSAGQALMTEMDSVIDFSMSEVGEIEIEYKEYSLKEFVNDVYGLVLPRMQYKAIDFKTDITDTIPDKLCGDCVRLKQILLNLIMYAISKTENASIRLGIFGKVVDDNKVHLLISVKDIKSPKKMDQRIVSYKKFMEADNYTISEHDSEISISIVKGLLKAMGSELKISESEERGNDYYFEIDQGIIDGTPIGNNVLKERKINW